MKFKLLLLSLLCSAFSFAQMQDIAKLADGKLVFNTTLFDSDNNLYGYFYIYERDVEKTSKKMEFVLLDKNLNKTNNGTYNDSILPINMESYYYDCTLMGNHIILDKVYRYYKFISVGSDFLLNTYQIISLKDNTVSPEFKYENGQFVELTTEIKKLKNENKNVVTKSMMAAFSNNSQKGFFITEHNKDNKNYLEKEFKFFNENKQLQWSYEYNPNGTIKDNKNFRFLYVKNNNLYITESRFKNDYNIEYKIIALDFSTGKKKYEYVFENEKSKYMHSFELKEIDNKLIISGGFAPYKKGGTFFYENCLGLFKIVIDENGNEIQKKYINWTDLSNKIKINKKGRVEQNFMLLKKKTFFFDNGSVSILTEKYRPEIPGFALPIPLINIAMYYATHRSRRTSDFVLLNFDKDFNLSRVDTIKKDLTKENATDYLFSQYIKNDKGVVFFYSNLSKDENKKKNMVLGINSLINGELSQERIPIYSKKKYLIEPLPAKEGYVMLREYNEKDKYNQIRLEKLNY
jgi:hypothetical protein